MTRTQEKSARRRANQARGAATEVPLRVGRDGLLREDFVPRSVEAMHVFRFLNRERHLLHLSVSALRNDQESPLLRLPAEVRNRIYDYVYTTRFVQITYIPSNDLSADERGRWNKETYNKPQHKRLRSVHINRNKDEKCPDNALALTCRRLHFDTRLLSFEHSIYSFGNPAEMKWCLDIMKPGYLAAIKGLDICWIPLESQLKKLSRLAVVYLPAKILDVEQSAWVRQWALLSPKRLAELKRFWQAEGVSIVGIEPFDGMMGAAWLERSTTMTELPFEGRFSGYWYYHHRLIQPLIMSATGV